MPLEREWRIGLRRAALVAVASIGLAAAEKPKAPPAVWIQKPSDDDWKAAEPADVKAGLHGRAGMRCKVLDDGSLDACHLIYELPAARGLGAALLSMAPRYRMGTPHPPEAVVPHDWYGFDTPADWKRAPSAAEIMSVWPREAAAKGQNGSTVISCEVTEQGAARGCVTLEENPPDMGFGQAAIALAPQFVFKPATFQGKPALSAVLVPVAFQTFGKMATENMRTVAPANLAWAEAPAYADLAAAYPKRAAAAKLAGKVTLTCQMTRDGRLSYCNPIHVEPEGHGFEIAARQLARRFRFAVATEAERSAANRLIVHMPFVFDPAILDPGPPTLGMPSWAKLPAAEDVASAFGEVKATGTLRAVLNCLVQAEGLVGDCRVESEDPPNGGAAAAALALAPRFRLSTWTSEGLPTIGARVRIPFRYEGGGE